MRMRLHPVRNVVGGPMLWPLEDTERVLPLYLRWLPEQPEDVYAFFMVLTVPPADPFPEAIRMRKACGLVWCITASPERAEAALDVFRAESPMLDGVDTLPYPALQSAFDPLAALGTHNAIAGAGFRSLPAAPAGAAFVRHQESAPTWLSFAHLYPLDGAAAREPEGGAAWPWREATFALMALGVRSEAGDDDELREWSASLCAELDPYALDGVYSNFLMDDGAAAAHASYGSSYERLARLKARVDPDNVFRANQNVEPAR
jgi:Berberine and berberine like